MISLADLTTRENEVGKAYLSYVLFISLTCRVRYYYQSSKCNALVELIHREHSEFNFHWTVTRQIQLRALRRIL